MHEGLQQNPVFSHLVYALIGSECPSRHTSLQVSRACKSQANPCEICSVILISTLWEPNSFFIEEWIKKEKEGVFLMVCIQSGSSTTATNGALLRTITGLLTLLNSTLNPWSISRANLSNKTQTHTHIVQSRVFELWRWKSEFGACLVTWHLVIWASDPVDPLGQEICHPKMFNSSFSLCFICH